MSSFPTRVALAIAFAMAAGWQVSAVTRNLTITFTNTQTGSSAECMASMTSGHKKALNVKHKHNIIWKLDGTGCRGFDPTKVVLMFDDKVMKNGMTFMGTPDSSNAKIGWINQDVTDVVADAPKLSRHYYAITYKGKNAGDPEIDIAADPAPGPTPPPVPPRPTGPTR